MCSMLSRVFFFSHYVVVDFFYFHSSNIRMSSFVQFTFLIYSLTHGNGNGKLFSNDVEKLKYFNQFIQNNVELMGIPLKWI